MTCILLVSLRDIHSVGISDIAEPIPGAIWPKFRQLFFQLLRNHWRSVRKFQDLCIYVPYGPKLPDLS